MRKDKVDCLQGPLRTRRDVLKMASAAAGTVAFGALMSKVTHAQAAPVVRQLVVGVDSDPGSVDPRRDLGNQGFSIIQHIYDDIIHRDTGTSPIPWLVEKWQQVTPTTLRFQLRKGVKFHNGEDFTAEAIKVTIQQHAESKLSPYKAMMSHVKDFKIADPYTIDLITEKPWRPLVRHITWLVCLSPRAVTDLGDKLATTAVGTGQMRFVEYKPGQHIVGEANPNYWGKKSNFTGIEWRFLPEVGTRVAALQAGEVMQINNVPPDQIAAIKANPNLRVEVSRTDRLIFLVMHTERQLFKDKRVRQAMNYAIDKDTIVKELLGGLAPVARAPIPQGVWGFNPNLPPYKYDPDRAKKLLADAGVNGATVNLATPNGHWLADKQAGEAIAGYLQAVGLKVAFDNPTWGVYSAETNKNEKSKYDMFMTGIGVGNGEPDHLLSNYVATSGLNGAEYSNPAVDALIEQGATTVDEAAAKPIYYKVQELIWDDAPWVFLWEQPLICATNAKLHWPDGGRRDERLLFYNSWLDA